MTNLIKMESKRFLKSETLHGTKDSDTSVKDHKIILKVHVQIGDMIHRIMFSSLYERTSTKQSKL